MGQSGQDSINHPAHYKAFPIEVIRIIELVLNATDGLTPFQYYCLGNEIKYRFRAGLKHDAIEDIGKAMKYMEFRNENTVPV